MTNSFKTHLKLVHAEESDLNDVKGRIDGVQLPGLWEAFTEATGWEVRTKRSESGKGAHNLALEGLRSALANLDHEMQLVTSPMLDGVLDIDDSAFMSSQVSAGKLLQHIDALVKSLQDAEKTIQTQEAQLATSIGMSIRAEESEALAERMQESLHRAVMQTASDAAAIYLLDDNTSELKLRSCWGLPMAALTQPARPLRGALADLEALMGNAVLLENTSLAVEWNCPENFSAAMCLPIGGPSSPLGTIWLWSDQVRDFSTLDIEAAKAASDMILADIQRTVLTDQVLRSRELNRNAETASVLQASRLPTPDPLHRDYEVAGWTFQGACLGGNFHAWSLNRFGQIIAVLGDAVAEGSAGAIVSTTVQSVVEAVWSVRHEPRQLLRKVNDLLWAIPDGDWRCSLGYLQLESANGQAVIGIAGSIQAFIVNSRGYRMLTSTETLLGEQPDTVFKTESFRMEGGELLVMASADLMSGLLNGGFTQTSLLNTIRQMHEEPIQEIADHLAQILPMRISEDQVDPDRSLLLLRRRF